MKKKCLYCGKETDEKKIHFACPICGNGMCDQCFDNGVGTDLQYFDIEEMGLDKKLYNQLMGLSHNNPLLICINCVSKLSSPKSGE
jgi:hypothetical protein